MTIRLYDNSIDSISVDLLEKSLYSCATPWYIPEMGLTTSYDPNIDDKIKKNSNIVDSVQFVHRISVYGKTGSNLHPMITGVIGKWFANHFPPGNENVISITRIKANLMPLQNISKKDEFYNLPHIDPSFVNPKLKDHRNVVFLYYVNDSDGDTFFFGDKIGKNIEKRVSPKKGRLVVFDGNHYHASSPPQNEKSRCVINANILSPYEVKDLL